MIQTAQTHLRAHGPAWFISFALALLVTVSVGVHFGLFKAQADNTPTFIKDITYTGGAALTSPADFYGAPWGITSDPSGNIYVAANAGGKVIKFDPSGTILSSFGSPGNGNGQFQYADGITRDAAGNIYVADYGGGNNRIEKFDASGNYLMQFPVGWVVGVAVDPSGNIYTSTSGQAPIGKYDSSGNLITNLNLSDPLGTWHPGIVSDTSGNIYIADFNNNKVKKIDGNGTILLSFGSAGSSTGQFDNLSGIAVDASGDIYVGDAVNNGRIQKFDASGNFLMQFYVPLSSLGYLIGITIDPAGNIYVGDNTNTVVFKFDSAGDLLHKIVSGTGSFTTPNGNRFHPLQVTKDSQGNIYADDDWYGGIFKFNANGDFLLKFGGYGSNPDQFSWPSDIAIDSSDNVYVSDCGSSVKKFAQDGTFITSFGSAGTGNGQFTCPAGLVVDSHGNLYVSDDNYSGSVDRIEKFDASGNYVSQFGSRGTGDGQFQFITSMYVDASENIYIVDSNNARVEKFDTNGNFLLKFSTTRSDNTTSSYPEGVVVDSLGNIYVSDSNNNNIQKFDSSGNFLSVITSAGGNAFNGATGLFLDHSGILYASDYSNGRIAELSIATPPLAISSVSASSSATSTTVSYTTDDLGSTQVEFGPSLAYGSSSPISNISPKVTSHAVTLTGLASCAVYNYRVKSANDTSTTTSANYLFTTDSCTGQASSTATNATTASTTATSTVTLSTITVSVPPTFSTTTVATTTFQAVKLEPTAFFASSSVPEGTKAATVDVFHLTALTSATTTLTTFTAPITVTLTYDPQKLVGIDETTLKIYRYDTGAWNVLANCTRDPVAHTVTCETSHFSDFTILGAPDTSSTSSGGSGFINPPSSILTSTPPATTTVTYTATTSTITGSTTTPPKPVPTPVKVIPKPKPQVKATSSKPVPVSLPSYPTFTPSSHRPVGMMSGTSTATSTATTTVATSTPRRVPMVPQVEPVKGFWENFVESLAQLFH
jgi:tripartite motif-containing protein 71